MVLRHSITLGGYLRPLWWSQRKLGGMLAAPCGCFNVAEPYVVCLKRLLFNIWGMYRIDLKCFRNNQGIVAWKIFLHRKHKSLRMSRVVNVCLSIDWLRCLVCKLFRGFPVGVGGSTWCLIMKLFSILWRELMRMSPKRYYVLWSYEWTETATPKHYVCTRTYVPMN